MTYTARLEWLCDHAAILRLYEGEPADDDHPTFLWACTVLRDGEVAILKGAVACPPIDGCRAIIRALRAGGMKHREYERISWRGSRLVSKRNGATDAEAAGPQGPR